MAILFIDLVGSVELYQLGDAQTYAIIKRHFASVTRIVEACGGNVVKTIGDAVMAAFDVPEDATRAAFGAVLCVRELQRDESLPRDTARLLKIRAGCHVGPCLAVTSTSGQIDYFGSTIHIASQTVELASGSEIVISQLVSRTTNVYQLLKKLEANSGVSQKRERIQVKGAVEMEFTRIQVGPSFSGLPSTR
jgi:adenylate cyclase